MQLLCKHHKSIPIRWMLWCIYFHRKIINKQSKKVKTSRTIATSTENKTQNHVCVRLKMTEMCLLLKIYATMEGNYELLRFFMYSYSNLLLRAQLCLKTATLLACVNKLFVISQFCVKESIGFATMFCYAFWIRKENAILQADIHERVSQNFTRFLPVQKKFSFEFWLFPMMELFFFIFSIVHWIDWKYAKKNNKKKLRVFVSFYVRLKFEDMPCNSFHFGQFQWLIDHICRFL